MLIKSRALPTEIKFLVSSHHGKIERICHCCYLYCDSAYLQVRLRPNCTELLASPSLPSLLLQGGSTGITEITSSLNAV